MSWVYALRAPFRLEERPDRRTGWRTPDRTVRYITFTAIKAASVITQYAQSSMRCSLSVTVESHTYNAEIEMSHRGSIQTSTTTNVVNNTEYFSASAPSLIQTMIADVHEHTIHCTRIFVGTRSRLCWRILDRYTKASRWQKQFYSVKIRNLESWK